MKNGKIFAVLTGDIVDSSGVKYIGQQPILELIENTEKRVRVHFQDIIHARIDVFRGDSWQLVVNGPELALRIGLYFRALFKACYEIDSRVSIGFGPVDFLPADNVSTGTGLAFTLSGQGLEKCKKPFRMNLSFPTVSNPMTSEGFNTIIKLIDYLVVGWTPGQAQAVGGALIGSTQAEIATNWQPGRVSQQAISQHLENAGWTHIKHALHYLEVAVPMYLNS